MKRRTQGMKWIRPAKRLAIYLRDGLACVWCSATVEHAKLTLDHCTPYSKGGSHKATNLVTCCHLCNSRRGKKSLRQYAAIITARPERVLTYIQRQRRLPLDVLTARQLIAKRGGFVAAYRGVR